MLLLFGMWGIKVDSKPSPVYSPASPNYELRGRENGTVQVLAPGLIVGLKRSWFN